MQELLRNGISVLTSVNLLHVEEYKEKVQAITGKDTAETIPKSFLLAADEIVIVDVPTDLCLWRLGEKLTSIGISNYQERKLSELRELALLLTAEVVDAQLESYVHAHGIEPVFGRLARPHDLQGAVCGHVTVAAARFPLRCKAGGWSPTSRLISKAVSNLFRKRARVRCSIERDR